MLGGARGRRSRRETIARTNSRASRLRVVTSNCCRVKVIADCGWAGATPSPRIRLCAASASVTSKRGSPVSRSKTKSCPDFVGTATASIKAPSRPSCTSVGGAGRSRSHRSCRTTLVVPPQDAGSDVQRKERVGVQIVALSSAAIEIGRSGPGRCEQQLSIDVQRHAGPGVCTPRRSPGRRQPTCWPPHRSGAGGCGNATRVNRRERCRRRPSLAAHSDPRSWRSRG